MPIFFILGKKKPDKMLDQNWKQGIRKKYMEVISFQSISLKFNAMKENLMYAVIMYLHMK